MTPAVWNLRVLFTVGIVLASVACVSSLLLLSMSLNSWQEGSIYQRIGLGGISYGQVTTSIYLKVSVSDFLTLFSARAGEQWFWSSRPSPILLGAGALALATSTALACLWPLSRPDGIPTLGLLRRGNNHILPVYIWIYCIVWWFIQVLYLTQLALHITLQHFESITVNAATESIYQTYNSLFSVTLLIALRVLLHLPFTPLH